MKNAISWSSRRTASNRIRGPQSALTDFLASNHISSAQIQADHARRQREAEQQRDREASRSDENASEQEDDRHQQVETTVQKKKKRKRDQERALAQIRDNKIAKKRKKREGDDLETDDDKHNLFTNMYTKKKPLPGQFENCELCEKRFTVTPYSKTGPNGGLLCVQCSKEQEVERKKNEKVKKQSSGREKRRQKQSELLDGIVRLGVKSLQQLCMNAVANNIHHIDEFGDLPQALLNPLSQLLSKNRLITSRTVDLFLHPDLDIVNLYECGNLETADYIKIFSVMPTLRRLNLRNAGQFKDEVLDYMMERNVPIECLHLEATNLVSNEKWVQYFSQCGDKLQSLKLAWLDNTMDETTFAHIVRSCPNLKQIKIRKCFNLGDQALVALSSLKRLEQLSLQDFKSTSSATLARLILTIGPNLTTLSLGNFVEGEDEVLVAIRSSCVKLKKLLFTGTDCCTDAGFEKLFFEWVNHPLSVIDLSKDRFMDNSQPDGPEKPIGLASNGFKALLNHSGSTLEQLDITSCRHIEYESFLTMFDGIKQYPLLKELALNFLTKIDTTVVAGIFRSCPRLKKLQTFGCFNVTHLSVPKGVAVIGLPNVQDSIVQEGDVDIDIHQ